MAVILILILLYRYCVCSALAVDIYTLDDSVGLGRPFDGIGGISGGGEFMLVYTDSPIEATSKLLINYPEPYRSHILDYLFLPNFGASLHILKVEIGGDGQSTGYIITDSFDVKDGTEASHMHNSWDENYERGYEWWLMVEAKKRNPDIKIYGLPWSFPGWLNEEGKRNPYEYPERTATYIIKWIQGAKHKYNITVDYVGIWNEKNYDKGYIKTLRKSLDKANLTSVKIVAPDAPHINDWKICPDIMSDPELAAAVEIVGCHYPGTLTTPEAVRMGKPLWASEDYSTFNDVVGGGCWARLLNQNYVNGNITGTLSWNLIAAYYDSLPFTRDGLMTAESPWSGHYVVETPVWMTAHTTQFTEIGWRYFRHGNGAGHLDKGGSYVALQSPDGKDLTVVIETMSHDHSKCIRPPLPSYNVSSQKVELQLKGKFAGLTSLNMWNSQLRFSDKSPSSLFQKLTPVQVIKGSVYLTLGVDEVITLTTVATGMKGIHPAPPPALEFPLPYYDDFENYEEHEEPYNFAQQTGSFEVIDSGEGKLMRQMVTQRPIYWCAAELIGKTLSLIGSVKWKNLFVALRFRLGKENSTDGAYVAARVDKGGCKLSSSKGIFFAVYPKTRRYVVSLDLNQSSVISSGFADKLLMDGWNSLVLLVQGNTANGLVNGDYLFNVTIATITSGFAGLGTTSFGIADFDNVMLNGASDGDQFMPADEELRFLYKEYIQKVLKDDKDDKLYFKPRI